MSLVAGFVLKQELNRVELGSDGLIFVWYTR